MTPDLVHAIFMLIGGLIGSAVAAVVFYPRGWQDGYDEGYGEGWTGHKRWLVRTTPRPHAPRGRGSASPRPR